MTIFEQLLDTLEINAKTNREKGNYFENLTKVFLENDSRYKNQFSQVEIYSNWAKSQGINGQDLGIDLIATNTEEPNTYTAIQCKFYQKDQKISKKEIDSFIANSSRDNITRRILVDTTIDGLNSAVLTQLDSLSGEFNRISLQQFEDSNIDWQDYLNHINDGRLKDSIITKAKKTPLAHQQQALYQVLNGFREHHQGVLLMACGTGKTYISLQIAEQLCGTNKKVLFLVPSLALMSQTISEYSRESNIPLELYAVCSDSEIGKRTNANDEIAFQYHDLAIPATTNAITLTNKAKHHRDGTCQVIFATYHSIGVINLAQSKYNLAPFDLIICDEAHRTTGATINDSDDSNFVKIHDRDYILGAKRLYMTATPKVYINSVKEQAKESNAELYSMDDEAIFGPVFYSLKFGEAVEMGLLSDYKVLILALDEKRVSLDIQNRLNDPDNGGLKLDRATKMIGCYKAIIKNFDATTKQLTSPSLTNPIRRGVVFSTSIKDSKNFTDNFPSLVNEYLEHHPQLTAIDINIKHVDGSQKSSERERSLAWLKSDVENDQCRILSNARCLSEGVDVPSLDAVIFMDGRKSKVDIVQAVGRVMRRAPDKHLGYVVIPIAIPSDADINTEISKSKSYSIVWDVVNALRSHDERMESMINQIDLTEDIDGKKQAIKDRIEIVSLIDKLPTKQSPQLDKDTTKNPKPIQSTTQDKIMSQLEQTSLDFNDSVTKAILAKMVERCGNRNYWLDWVDDVAMIANSHITRIKANISDKTSHAYYVFKDYVAELKDNLNDSILEDEVIEMLAQHIITKPVFDALFEGYSFTQHNSISKSMQTVLEAINADKISDEAESLDKFYQSVKRRVQNITDPNAKQKIIIELYDNFFRNAFPKMSQRLGIVYTPIECIDFIIHSVNDILKQEFNQELGDKNTHIVDPFTGTGSFITRLMQSGLLSHEQLIYKYNSQEKTINGEKITTTEIHANELVLLAYYIASINIEQVYHAIIGGEYQPFEGICLTDTFQLTEKDEDLITPQLEDNYHRRKVQKKLPIRVFIGNPPYSAGQGSGNDNNQNLKYPKLDSSIGNSYEKYGTSTNNNSLYDSYIRAIRWASDRIDKYGVIGFITNAGWLDSNSADGMRKCLADEFSSIYIFNLRGAIRGKSGDVAKREGQNVFDIMTGVAISILVKNPQAKDKGKIYYYDIGDYLSRDDKLKQIVSLKSIANITNKGLWQSITPDKYHDWLNLRDDGFYNHISMGDKKNKTDVVIFENYSRGLATSRDAWVYNYSKNKLANNVTQMIDFYNIELARYQNSEAKDSQPQKLADAEKYIANFVNNDSSKIAWSRDYRYDICRNTKKYLNINNIVNSLYRPYTKSYCFFDKQIAMELYQLPKIFPEDGVANLVIGVSGIGSKLGFSCMLSNILPDLMVVYGMQCFPLYLYEPCTSNADDLFCDNQIDIITLPNGNKYKRRSAITDDGLQHFINHYHDSSITAEDLFYYIYGLLHSEEYRLKYADNLTKALPRIPCAKSITDFRVFVTAGRELANLHINYENIEPYPVSYAKDISNLSIEYYNVSKCKFSKLSDKSDDKSTIIYNSKITITDIPLDAYNYVVNGKSAIEWVMERQGISTHKDSGIINNANDWAIETMHNHRYSLDLLLRVITISLKTVEIVASLPKLHL